MRESHVAASSMLAVAIMPKIASILDSKHHSHNLAEWICRNAWDSRTTFQCRTKTFPSVTCPTLLAITHDIRQDFSLGCRVKTLAARVARTSGLLDAELLSRSPGGWRRAHIGSCNATTPNCQTVSVNSQPQVSTAIVSSASLRVFLFL